MRVAFKITTFLLLLVTMSMAVSGAETKDEASEKTVFVGRRLGSSRGLNYNAVEGDRLKNNVETDRQLGMAPKTPKTPTVKIPKGIRQLVENEEDNRQLMGGKGGPRTPKSPTVKTPKQRGRHS
jgi:hypothetical protein